MPNSTYASLLAFLNSYLPQPKGAEVLDRQIAACKLNADTLSTSDLHALSNRIACAGGLYIDDAKKREEFKAKALAL